MRTLSLLIALALVAPPAAAAQVVPTPTPTIFPSPEPEPEPPPPAPPGIVDPPPPGTQTVTRGFDLAHTFHSAEPAARQPLGVAWKVDFDSHLGSPLVVEGRVFVPVGNQQGQGANVAALGAATGRELWRAPLTGFDYSAYLAYGAGVLVAAIGPDQLHAFDPSSGAVKWSAKAESTSQRFPLVAGGLVYLEGNSVTHAFDLATGQLRFQMKTEGHANMPAFVGDRLYVAGTCDAAAFDARNGQAIWARRFDGCPAGRAT